MMALVEQGGMGALGYTDALSAPWWWSRVVQIWTRIKGIREAGAYDVEKMTAPREYWLSPEKLEAWFDEREKLREQQSKGVLPDY